MQRRDGVSDKKVLEGLAQAAITADTNGVEIDAQPGQIVTALIHLHTITDGTYVLKVQEAKDDAASPGSPDAATWRDAPLAKVIGGAFPTAAATDDNVVKKLGYLKGGEYRHVRIRIEATGTTTGGVFSVIWELEGLRYSGKTEVENIGAN